MLRVSCAAIGVGLLAAGCSVEAAPRAGLGVGETLGHVVAESRYGHGTVSGPVRAGNRGGHQVRMPGGTWLDCGKSCAETLRRETVDFWESRGGRNDPVDGPGYLRWKW